MPTPPDTLRERFFASDFRVGVGLATFADLDKPLFQGLETIEQVSADRAAMDAIAGSEDYRELVRSVNAMDAQLVNTPAMNAVGASQIARDAIQADSGVFSRIKTNPMPLGKFFAGKLGLTPSNFADYSALVGDQSALSTIGDDASLAALANDTPFSATVTHKSSFIESDYGDSAGSQETWDSGTSNAPFTQSVSKGQDGDTLSRGGTTLTFQTPTATGYAFGCAQRDDPVDPGTWERTFDFDKISEIVLTTRLTDSTAMTFELEVGGTNVLTVSTNGTTTNTVSVSQTGLQTLKMKFVSQGKDGTAEVAVLKFN